MSRTCLGAAPARVVRRRRGGALPPLGRADVRRSAARRLRPAARPRAGAGAGRAVGVGRGRHAPRLGQPRGAPHVEAAPRGILCLLYYTIGTMLATCGGCTSRRATSRRRSPAARLARRRSATWCLEERGEREEGRLGAWRSEERGKREDLVPGGAREREGRGWGLPHARHTPPRGQVLAQHAEHELSRGAYTLAARQFAKTGRSVEEVALRFLSLGQKGAPSPPPPLLSAVAAPPPAPLPLSRGWAVLPPKLGRRARVCRRAADVPVLQARRDGRAARDARPVPRPQLPAAVARTAL